MKSLLLLILTIPLLVFSGCEDAKSITDKFCIDKGGYESTLKFKVEETFQCVYINTDGVITYGTDIYHTDYIIKQK